MVKGRELEPGSGWTEAGSGTGTDLRFKSVRLSRFEVEDVAVRRRWGGRGREARDRGRRRCRAVDVFKRWRESPQA
jgi:hypothetical protein